ncbi:furin-like protease 2 isoform X1 [Leptopilina boulardi]|uniref:furin-like protease 2 isoform X1 n=1 Tax=Leptopilina boulardi TaxID=63433 RepID=UPI0021F64CCB|nr:furin-like protease 2 isoform X1 [Leptopilina boulardi]XP_051169951.1 furin-like protease 2 isoform X1 [Leptopilina boulardi]
MMNPRVSLLWLGILLVVSADPEPASRPRPKPIYTKDFVVHVPAGDKVAAAIAEKHGFQFQGQIGALTNYFHFTHERLRKRSLAPSDYHHKKLNDEPEVHWVQQQHEKKRHKRDFHGTTYTFSEFPHFLDRFGTQQRSFPHQQRNREIHVQNLFPDPLYKEEWYMNGGSKDGYDMNVAPAWERGYTGKGVVVSILDDGIQTNHPDLAANYDQNASYDINGNDDDPMPRDNGDNKHGTRCAGEVAAVAFNQYCGVGVAYNASIGGVRMLDGVVNDAVEAKALGLNPDHIDIYSASWGPEDDGKTVDGPGPLARRAFIYGVTSGRQGKGSIFVWASGNGGRHTDCCNCDGYTNSIFTLSISSATQGGYKPWYLEECSSTLASTYSSGSPGNDKSIATVDMDGKLRPDHICTVEHTGTSASAPIAAGIAALALEANPSLTWRDMQYLVVLTSRSAPLQKESGWVLNGVKRKVSHKFGYGLMDAGAMVKLAEQWTNVPVQHICKSPEHIKEQPIDPTYGNSLTVAMDVNGCSGTPNEVQFLEHVQCKISLRFFPLGNLKLLLTSPMGTTSTLLFERPRDTFNFKFDDWPFLSVHFWGEKAAGRWTLQVINAGRRHVQKQGILQRWQLIFYGTSTNPIRLRSHQYNPVQTASQAYSSSVEYPFFFDQHRSADEFRDSDFFARSGFQGYQGPYTGAASNVEASVTTLDGASNPLLTNRLPGDLSPSDDSFDSGKKIRQQDCDPQCDIQGCYGKGPTQCVACKSYRLDNTCISRCPPRSFPNQAGVCWPCHESCETCAGAGQDSCLSCAPAHLRVTDLAICLQQCPEGYYENTENSTCVPCEANCASCQDRPDHCTSCENHLVMYGNKCYAACPLYTYETQDYNCVPCHSTCETCNGTGENQCIRCRPGLFVLNGRCTNSCPDGYSADKKYRECIPCSAHCATCDSSKCTSCIFGWSFNKKGECTPDTRSRCDSSEFYEAGHCKPCHSTCETCVGPTEDFCISCQNPLLLQGRRCVAQCDDGYYSKVQPSGPICAPCLQTCKTCVSEMNCTTCQEALQLQSGECRSSCAEGYYSDRGQCAKCYLSCKTCSGPRRDQCVSCPTAWQLASGECHPECPEGDFRSKFGCRKCHHYCKTCKGEGPLECTSCPPRSMLEGGLCMECLGGQYYDSQTQLCKNCHESCRTCTGPGKYNCASCAKPLHLHKLNNQCVLCCAANEKKAENDECCLCDPDTGSCRNSSPAGKRRVPGTELSSLDSLEVESAAQYGNTHNLDVDSLNTSAMTVMTLGIFICMASITLFVSVFGVLQLLSRRREVSMGYTQLAVRVEHLDEGDVDDTTELMT